MSQRKKSQRTQKNKKTQRLSTIKEEPNRRNSSLRRRNPKRKRQGSNEDLFTASRIGYHLSRTKNNIFQRSLQPQLRLPRTNHKQNTNLLTREINKYKPRYTFKGLGKIIGTRI